MKKFRVRKKIYNRWKNSIPPPLLEACREELKRLHLEPWPEAFIWRPHRPGQRCRLLTHKEEMNGWLKLSEKSLAKVWDTPEEDAAWAHLGGGENKV